LKTGLNVYLSTVKKNKLRVTTFDNFDSASMSTGCGSVDTLSVIDIKRQRHQPRSLSDAKEHYQF